MIELVLVLAGVFLAGTCWFTIAAWSARRRDLYGLFAVLAAMMVAYLLLDVAIWRSTSAAEALTWVRWHAPLIYGFFPLLVLLLWRWTGVGKRMFWAVLAAWTAVGFVELIATYGIFHAQMPVLATVATPFGGSITRLGSTAGPHWGMGLYLLAWSLTVLALAWQATREWRTGHRGRSRLLGLFCLLLIAFTAHDMIVDMGWLQTMYLGEFCAPLMLTAVAWRLHDEQRSSVEKARSTEAFHRVLVEAAEDGICVIEMAPGGSELRFLVWNQGMVAFTGRSLAEVEAGGWYGTCVPAGDRRRQAERLQAVQAGEPITDEEWPILHADGEERRVSVSCSLLPRVGGRQRVLAVMRDVTNRRLKDEQLQRTQKLESLGVLAGGIAHDFNNLLMAVLGRAGLAALDLPSDHPGREHLAVVERTVDRAADLCRQLLAYAGKGQARVEAVDLGALLREMVDMLAVGTGHQAAVEMAIPDALPPVQGDPSQLRQVVMNLVTNAAEAMAGRDGVVTVALTERHLDADGGGDGLSSGSYLELRVQDRGCGMDAETVRRVFEPFFTTKFTGRGLGMAAVRGIVSAHNGRIDIASQEGRGTTVQVLLPVRHHQAVPQPEEPSPLRSVALDARPRVLVVDDEEAVREITGEMLQSIACDAELVDSGQRALRLVAADPRAWDLVILDLTMPGMDGAETSRRLAEIAPDLPVVLCSGYSKQQMRRDCGATVRGFLAKPYDAAALKRCLAKALAGEPAGS